MEELRIAVWIFSGITMTTCLLFLFLIKQWEYRHPRIFTEKATLKEKQQYKKMVVAMMNTILLYIMLFILVLSFMSYGNLPLGVWLVCGFGILYVITTFISIFRNK
ncbi:MAG: hypothetical protein IKV11_00215 [Alphaproteobacteria bacterium]|nr:hypothetical protein [Alphaproteobacteria bacterium]